MTKNYGTHWSTISLGEFVSLQRGHDLPAHRRKPGAVPVMGSFGVTGHHDSAKAKGPGVTVGRSGASFGVVSYSPVDFWPLNTALYVTDFHGNDERFAYYFLKTLDLKRFNSGSAQPSLNRNFIHPIRVEVPGPNEQRAISRLLGALDDKIDLYRRTNETMEGIARALFRSWFVDDSRGTPRRGWSMGRLGDVVENVRDGVNAADIRSDAPYVALEHIPRRSVTLYKWAVADGVASNKFRFRCGEILFGKLRPYFHKVAVAPIDGVCSTDILVIVPKSSEWFSFSLFHASSDDIIAHADAVSTGTKMPRCNWADLAGFEIAIPPVEIARAFDKLVRPMVEKMIAGVHESRTLGFLRDALLPKLLSGEVRLRDEGEVATAV